MSQGRTSLKRILLQIIENDVKLSNRTVGLGGAIMKIEDAQRGARVRCINGHFESRKTDPFGIEDISLPREGQIYTIREVVQTAEGMGIRLLDVQNPQFRHDIGGTEEPCFGLNRFELIAKNK